MYLVKEKIIRTIVIEADINKGKRLGSETSERQRGKRQKNIGRKGGIRETKWK